MSGPFKLNSYTYLIYLISRSMGDIGLSVINRPNGLSDAFCQTIDEGYRTNETSL